MFFLIETPNLGSGYNQELIHESKVDGIRPWKNDTTMVTVGPRQIFVDANLGLVVDRIQTNKAPICNLIFTKETNK